MYGNKTTTRWLFCFDALVDYSTVDSNIHTGTITTCQSFFAKNEGIHS